MSVILIALAVIQGGRLPVRGEVRTVTMFEKCVCQCVLHLRVVSYQMMSEILIG